MPLALTLADDAADDAADEVLLVSCYSLGHQPVPLAVAKAALAEAGVSARVIDTARTAPTRAELRRARLIAISVPMHTALRLGVALARQARALNPDVALCFFGLYAPLNAGYLLDDVLADVVLGPEDTATLAVFARAVTAAAVGGRAAGAQALAVRPEAFLRRRPGVLKPVRVGASRLDRAGLPPLERYARLRVNGEDLVVGHVETTRGCKHVCRHCPITPVYQGRFFALDHDVVLADIDDQMQAGARHISFGDPDFLNGPTHSLRIARALHARHPGVTWDATIKIEHVLDHRALFPELASLGCLFIVSAVESLSDLVLTQLRKDHTGADVRAAHGVLRAAGIALRPTWVAFTPWTTAADYLEMLDFIQDSDLTDALDPVQLAVRLLIPPHSAILEVTNGAPWLLPLDEASLSYAWRHPDPRMDILAAEMDVLAARAVADAADGHSTLARMADVARARLGGAQRPFVPLARAPSPRLTEPWFCCSEPTAQQLALVSHGADG